MSSSLLEVTLPQHEFTSQCLTITKLCQSFPDPLHHCFKPEARPFDCTGPCRTEPEAAARAQGRAVRFLANVDPVDVARALNGFAQEETLVVVVSKTFTTAETMLNARTVR